MKAVMPACGLPSSAAPTRAKVMTSGAYFAFVMNCLRPLRIHASPSRRAVARSDAASLPLVASVSANAPRPDPSVSRGSHRARCSGVP